ncbi:MAG: protein kinase [Verrucomicrobia bacterium]|nr:protein kinase [Verrucomicrobiota bacterium]
MEKIGSYQIVRSLGKGGMGEVFLAYDPVCKREVALKRMRPELVEHLILKERFLREAHVASRLTHPSIVPIFSIEQAEGMSYYTMPYVAGQTLKEILKATLDEERKGEITHPIGRSIPALARIFLAVCEAIAYTHAKGILHRDLKPDNIIVGNYGEVLILDWGLADFIGKEEKILDTEVKGDYKDLTDPGKVPGTLNFLAPERARSEPSTVATDIYSLGVLLYQLLTLRPPFHRESMKHFRKTMHLERLVDPQERSPYRDIPEHLADIAKKCLQYAPSERFSSVDVIIHELKRFLEGKPEWVPAGALDVHRKEDWEFQEHILIAKHMAITRSPDVMEWVSLMISKASFTGNTKIDTKIRVKNGCQGIGLLTCVPELPERKGLEEGYSLWIGTWQNRGLSLFHSGVEVMTLPDVYLHEETWQSLSIQKIDSDLFFYLNGDLLFHYVSHTPMTGTHVGILCRDGEFTLEPLQVQIGSQNALVRCLAIPDAFLACKLFGKALVEYRRIASSFSGRTEGREALFRAGITLLEQATSSTRKKEREHLYLLALDEFGKLRQTPGAPLEYLGKSLVYKATGEIEEEIKCLELCLRKYPKHPLLKLVRQQVTFRLHESSARDRIAAYHFALLALCQLPQIFEAQDMQRLLSALKKHLESLPFLPDASTEAIAFWLARPIPLVEQIESSSEKTANAFYALLAMGLHEWVRENLHLCKDPEESQWIACALLFFEKGIKNAFASFPKQPSKEALRCALFLFDQALLYGKSREALPLFDERFSSVDFDALHIRALLLENRWVEAGHRLDRYSEEERLDEYSPLFALMGCYLRKTCGKEAALSHFSGCIELHHPPTTLLLSYFLQGKTEWLSQAFVWEKIHLQRDLHLFYHCAKNAKKAKEALKQIKKELKSVHSAYSYP